MYQLLRNILFNFDAERVHHFSMKFLKLFNSFELIHNALLNHYQINHLKLEREVFGVRFKNPVGLGAGFDKNALFINELETLGFGFIEIGTVTPQPQLGNVKPRLFRLPKDKAIINRMGFNNDGVKVIANRLSKLDKKIIIGGNIGKNKATPNEDAWKDYEICFRELFNYVDYFVVNVSSPNTPGLRELQDKEILRKILSNLQDINKGKLYPRPLLLKIAPDLTIGQIEDIAQLSKEVDLSGLVVANTTISRDGLKTSNKEIEQIGAGGLSGKPLKEKSSEIVKYLYNFTNGSLPIIASGGIFNGYDALEKLQCGASLIQLWTGFIYEGPSIVKNICSSLLINSETSN